MRRWNEAEAGKSDIEQLVFLSNLIGSDPSLVQPGGGNTSVKLKEPDWFACETHSLVVKGSGTDLRTVGPAGFTHLYLDRLSLLRQKDSLSDEEMMALMRACMLFPDRDPVPSVETPLHALLSARFVAHTHDVATLSLTDAPHAEENARRVFGQEIAFLEYVRPGFPLAKRLAERYAEGPPAGAIALVMEKHGLAVWGDTAGDCYETLRVVIEKSEAFVAEQAAGKRAYDSPSATSLDAEARRDIASALLPAIRGELARGGWRCVLHLDDSPDTVEAIAAEEFPDIGARGVMTPEHILRAGVRPLIVLLEDDRGVGAEQHADRHPIDDGLAGVAQPLQHHADHIRHAIRTHRSRRACRSGRSRRSRRRGHSGRNQRAHARAGPRPSPRRVRLKGRRRGAQADHPPFRRHRRAVLLAGRWAGVPFRRRHAGRRDRAEARGPLPRRGRSHARSRPR